MLRYSSRMTSRHGVELLPELCRNLLTPGLLSLTVYGCREGRHPCNLVVHQEPGTHRHATHAR